MFKETTVKIDINKQDNTSITTNANKNRTNKSSDYATPK